MIIVRAQGKAVEMTCFKKPCDDKDDERSRVNKKLGKPIAKPLIKLNCNGVNG